MYENRIKHWRTVRGMSQQQLADKVELSQQPFRVSKLGRSVSRWT